MKLFSYKKVGNFFSFFVGAFGAFLMIGGMMLPSKVLAAPGDPVIVSFTRTPSTITLGQSSVLAWNVTGATSISINQGVGTVTGPTGSVSVSPNGTRTYTLTASNAIGTVTRSIVVSVRLPVISTFTRTPSSITLGQSSVLAWNVTGATSISINQGVGTVTGPTGSVSVSPTATTTYTLTATNGTGSVIKTATVTIKPPVVSSFTATPTTINLGQSSTLAWNVTGAASISIDQGVGTVTGPTGSVSVSPNGTTTYTLTARNGMGTIKRTVTVTVRIPPAISSFTATPSTINLGQSSVLAWNVTGATSISIDQGVGTVTGPTGSVSMSSTATTVYTLTATNSAGSVNATANITVIKFPVISSVLTSASTTMAMISWMTDENATSIVEYGETTAYGSIVSDPLFATTHSMYLMGLVENTTYHFRVSSQNAEGNITTTEDYTFKTKALGGVGGPAIPAGFANASVFTWGDEISPGVWNFSATYDWSDPAQLNDITAFNDSSLSLVGGRLQVVTGFGAEVHGFRFNQPARIDTCDQSTRLVSGDEVTIGFCLTQLSSTYMGGSFNPNPGLITANALWDSSYEISADGDTINGGSAGGSMNNWYAYSSIFSDTSISAVRADLGVPYIRNGSYSRDTDHYSALGFYNNGNPTVAQYGTVTITGAVKADAVDTTPPVVSAIASLPLDTSTTVTWTTNERSTSIVEYGITTEYGNTVSSLSSVISHSIQLTGLTANTVYHFRVTSRDVSGNIAVSEDGTFTTASPDVIPPTISSMYRLVSGTSATIAWTTNEPSNSLVEYGTTGYSHTASSETFVTSHSVTLTGLTTNTLYQFRVSSQDASGNTGTSQDSQFQTATSSSVLVDYTSVDQFANLSTAQIQAAAAIRLMFRHASVGGNISEGLDTLQSENALYNRTNFNFQFRGNPGWSEKLTDFSEQVVIQQSLFDVLTMKFCWIDNEASASAYISTMTNLESQYPTKTFIWWTMPTSVGDTLEQNAAYNQAIRTYALANNKILFDLASIESHEIDGTPCTSGGIENMCSGYTTDGGHLNAMAEARVTKAFWVLMSQIASRYTPPLQTPSGFANASTFTWGSEIAPNVRAFTATYDWSNASQLNDITAINTDTALSVSGGNLQVNGIGAIEGIHGFRFNQSARIDSCNQDMRFTTGDVISMGSCFSQVNDTYAGGTTYNPDPGLASEDAMWNGTYEVHVNGITTYGGTTGGVSSNVWYNYLNTFSDLQISIVRGDLGTPFTLNGNFTRDTLHYGAIGYYAGSNIASAAQYNAVTITGAMQTP